MKLLGSLCLSDAGWGLGWGLSSLSLAWVSFRREGALGGGRPPAGDPAGHSDWPLPLSPSEAAVEASVPPAFSSHVCRSPLGHGSAVPAKRSPRHQISVLSPNGGRRAGREPRPVLSTAAVQPLGAGQVYRSGPDKVACRVCGKAEGAEGAGLSGVSADRVPFALLADPSLLCLMSLAPGPWLSFLTGFHRGSWRLRHPHGRSVQILVLTPHLLQGFRTFFQPQLRESCGPVLPTRLLSRAVSGRESVCPQLPNFRTTNVTCF